MIAAPQFFIIFVADSGALAHLVERNTGSVEVSSSSLLCSTSRPLDLSPAVFYCAFS